MNQTVISKHLLYPRVPDTAPQLERDIDRMAEAEHAVLLYLDPADAGDDVTRLSPAQYEVLQVLKTARVILTKRLVKMTATPAAPWHVTDECGVLKASVFTVNHEGYHLRHPDGSHTIVPTLDDSDGGPWDGQHDTLTRERAPAAAVKEAA